MDDGLKQRLVGAIVLVAIAVLFLPSLFNREVRRTVDLTSQIPPEPAAVLERLEIPEPEQPRNIPPAKPLAEIYPHEPASEPVNPKPNPPTSETKTNGSAVSGDGDSVPDAHFSLDAQGVPNAWSLQVASFQSAERAEALSQDLRNQGHQGYVRAAKMPQGTVHRVFVGPKINKAGAEAAKRSIDKRFQTDALIVEFKP
jgi:DedD protein